jgi:chromosome segregation ATPase
LDDLRRKEQRSKREGEEWREEEKRLKELLRRGAEELAEVRKGQSEFVIERKKVLDEVVRLEGALAQKETEAARLAREVEKVRGKISEEM